MTITATPKSVRPHVSVVEVQDSETGYRFWSAPLRSSLDVNLWIGDRKEEGYALSDLCCSGTCWCISE